MKIFTKAIIAICFITSLSTEAFSIAYTSAGAGPAAWNNAATWSPAGIPTNADDVTISVGHTVQVNSLGCLCKNLTVLGTLNLTSNTLGVRGNYTVSGSETGSGIILFNSATTATITITGAASATSGYSFNTNVILPAGSTILKGNAGSANCILGANKTFTNLGSVTFGSYVGQAGSTFTNGLNANLTLRRVGFMAGRTFNANAVGNTVTLLYTVGAIPTASASGYYNLSLSSAAAGAKTLPSNTIVAKNLIISSSNTLNSNNFNLTVGGNWTNSGTFTATAGKSVTFNGSATQNVSNTSGTTTFKILVINNNSGVNLTSGIYILDEVLTVSAGTFNTGGRPFTMTSNASATARIGPLGATAALTGNFTIQRFITSRDTSYADLASPVQSSTFLDWNNAGELPAISYVSAPPTQQASANTYDETTDAYVPVTSSGTPLTPGQGFEVFLSGDFSYANLANTTLNTIGVPNQGDFDLSPSISNNVQGWNLVGNPFASSISWSAIYGDAGTSGLYDYIEMYDYTVADWSGYTTADAIEVGSSQGFWVYGLPGNGAVSLNIPETAKTTSANSSLKSAIVQPYFTLNMSSTEQNKRGSHTFKITASADASDGLDNKDIPFRASPCKATPALYSFVDGKKININNFNSSNSSYSMPLRTEAIAGNYKITAAGFDFINEYTCVKLEDKLLNTTVSLMDNNVYTFNVNTNDNPDRFVLHLTKNSDCKSAVNASSLVSDFANHIEVLPTLEGNVINFNLSETTNSTISVSNLLGQVIVNNVSLDASTQSVNIALPESFSGMYIVKIESEKGTVTKKFIRK